MVRLFENKPERFLLWMLIAQIVLWTAIPALCYGNAPLDVVENIAWGREWQMGYYKHPPLQAWLTEIAYLGGGGRIAGIYLVSQLCIAATQLALFALAREIAGAKAALWTVILFSLVYYCNLPSPEFNTNVVQMPLWALAGLALHRAINGKRVWWLALAVALAGGLYAKYSVVILIGTLALVVLTSAKGRAALKSPWPWLAAVLAAVLVAPQLIWLRNVEFLPLKFAAELNDTGFVDRLRSAASFVGAQAVDHILVVLLLVIGGAGFTYRGASDPALPATEEDRRFAAVLAIAPISLSVLAGVAGGFALRTMWGAPMVLWISLAAVLFLKPAFRRERVKAALYVWLALFIALPVGTGAASILGASRKKPPKIALPGPKLAASLTDIWYDQTGTRLDLVAGDTWPTGVVAAYSKDQPSVFVDANARYNPWVAPQRLAANGVMVVWTATDEMPANLSALGPFQARGRVQARYRYGGKLASISWAIHAPQPSAGPKP